MWNTKYSSDVPHVGEHWLLDSMQGELKGTIVGIERKSLDGVNYYIVYNFEPDPGQKNKRGEKAYPTWDYEENFVRRID